MRIFVVNSSLGKHELELEASTTIVELYVQVWKVFNISGDAVHAATHDDDGLCLIWAGKRLRSKTVQTLAAENNLSVEIIELFHGLRGQDTLADYNIQSNSTIHVCLSEANVRRRFHQAKREDCAICLQTMSDLGLVAYRQCENGHYFHLHCCQPKEVQKCALCRTEKWTV